MPFSKFLNPKNDVAFKRLFGQERNKDILIHFLNDVLDLNHALIQDVRYLPTIQDPELIARKESIVDVLCEDQQGKKYIIEMQVAQTKGFAKRAQFYASRAYGRQLKEGQEYHELTAVIFLAIADFKMFPEKSTYKSDHVILDKISYEHDLQDFSFTFIELPKFKKKIHQCKTLLEKWTYFFKHAQDTAEDELAALIGNDKILEKAYHEVNKTYWTEAEMNAYEADQKRMMDNKAALEAAKEIGEAEGLVKGEAIGMEKGEVIGIKKGEAIGMAIGMEKGEAIGIEKGEVIGIEKGKTETLRQMAKTMLVQGFDLKTISNITGLTETEIKLLDQ